MLIQNIMYFVLGFLGSGLLALMIVPSIWHRAVRLTKSRIEAATPMTMTEFRADKDQLRAEFALSTRRLEKNVEALRTRHAGQLNEINRKKTDLAQLKGDRDQNLAIIQELEAREGELRRKLLELEKTGADLAQKLRMRDREFSTMSAQIQGMREQDNDSIKTQQLTRALEELSAERQRSMFFQDQVTSLTTRLAGAEDNSADATHAISKMRTALANKEDEQASTLDNLVEAEARIANAEVHLNSLLEETHVQVEGEQARVSQLLAEKLSLEEELDRLRSKIGEVESSVYEDWENERLDQSHLRERLNDIASEVSRLVYAEEAEPALEESLFDRVRKFVGDDISADGISIAASKEDTQASQNGGLAGRMAALRDLQPN